MSMQRRIVIAIGGVIGLLIAYTLLSPLFIDRVVDEDLPGGPGLEAATGPLDEAQGTGEQPSAGELAATQTMEAAAAEPDTVMDDEMPGDDMATASILARGEFYDLAHEGSGTATVYQLADGSRVLRFEDFEVLNGPNLHVWLVPIDPVPDTVGSELPGYADLGALKGNIGNQNYDIPAELVLEDFASVVIWCVPFRVPFNAAHLAAP